MNTSQRLHSPVSMPILDNSNSLSRGLIAAWIPAPGGRFVDLLRRSPGNPTSVTAVSDAFDEIGRSVEFDTSDEHVSVPNVTPATLPISVFALANSTSVSGQKWFFGSTSKANYSGISMCYFSDDLYIQYCDGEGTSSDDRRTGLTTANMLQANVTHALSGSIAGPTSMKLYVDGKSYAVDYSGDGGAIDPGTPAEPGMIGEWRQVGLDFAGKIYCLYFWYRELSNAEHASLAQNPFQLIQTRPRISMSLTQFTPPPPPSGYSGAIKLFDAELGSGVVSNSYKGITTDKDGNLRVSGTIYEGA